MMSDLGVVMTGLGLLLAWVDVFLRYYLWSRETPQVEHAPIPTSAQ
jgi:hypothetical protein